MVGWVLDDDPADWLVQLVGGLLNAVYDVHRIGIKDSTVVVYLCSCVECLRGKQCIN